MMLHHAVGCNFKIKQSGLFWFPQETLKFFESGFDSVLQEIKTDKRREDQKI